jgi:Icc-related predicted phosphoesterase
MVRIGAVGDLHCSDDNAAPLHRLFEAASNLADVLLLCGDLTDYGTVAEAHLLARVLGAARTPIVAVLGNHDYEANHQDQVRAVLVEAGAHVLDGSTCEVHGIGFAGIKGFCGGFGARQLGAWGEGAIKSFVREALDEALKLESAVARLRTPRRVVLMHYAPVESTVRGEPPEIYPFLGCSRLEEPLLRRPADVVFHGHAHRGSAEGHTANGIPVYNVALPLLERLALDLPPIRVIEMSVEPAHQMPAT